MVFLIRPSARVRSSYSSVATKDKKEKQSNLLSVTKQPGGFLEGNCDLFSRATFSVVQNALH